MFRKQLLRQSRAVSRSFAAKPKVTVSSPRFLHTQLLPFRTPVSTSSRLHRRWQSTDAEQKPAQEASKGTEAPKEDPAAAELEKKNREIIDLKDKYLRSVADYRNLQDRTKRDMENARQFAIQRFATDLLDSIDNLDRALESVPQDSLALDSETSSSSVDTTTTTTANTSSSDPNAAAAAESISTPNPTRDLLNLHAGLKMSETILMATLKKHGMERFDPMEGAGRKFDPRFDEATFFTKVEGKQDGDVFHTQNKGFTLNGRVIRAAKVGVVKNS